MRVLPLALWHKGSDAELVRDARLQSRVTHGHPIAQLCCAMLCLWARQVGADAPDPWEQAATKLRLIVAGSPADTDVLEGTILCHDGAPCRGSGYVVDCLKSAKWASERLDYESVVRAAVSLGNDTDTTACVAGGIAGLRGGIDQIPERWRDSLRGSDIAKELVERLIERDLALRQF